MTENIAHRGNTTMEREGGIAMYISPNELRRRGLTPDAAGYAAIAREALRQYGVPPCDIALDVFDGVGGALLFCRLRLHR